MIERDLIWTGHLNGAAGTQIGGGSPVRLYDTTLRDGEQTVGLVLSPTEKLEIAQLVDRLGADRIEVGFPRVSDDDRRAIQMIVAAGLRAELWGFARAVAEDVDAVLDLGLRCSVIEAPISDLKLDALGVSRAKMIDRITKAVGHASDAGVRVAFFGVDGSRADFAYLGEVYAAAVAAGAAEVVAVDTLGIAAPEAASYLVARVREAVGGSVPIHYHGHDDFGLATSGAISAVRAGATWVHGTVNGMGERAGNANLPEVALALEALYGYSTNLDLSETVAVSRRIAEICGYALAPWSPLMGENLFRRETGAVAAQFHDPPAVEPYSSTVVGAKRGIVLGKKSGAESLRLKSAELGLDLSDEACRELLAVVKSRAIAKRGLLTDDEFVEIASSPANGRSA